MSKIIIKDNLIYQARAIDPDQAMWLAKVNGTLSPETFTLKYNNRILRVGKNGNIIEAGNKMLLVKDHLIYEVRIIPHDHCVAISGANKLMLTPFLKKYEGSTLELNDQDLTIIRNQTKEKSHA